MGLLLGLIGVLKTFNDHVLRVGRVLAAIALGLMVIFILAQIFYRYVLNNALPWPDEAARFMMLWMTGLIAPSALRRGGFVAIDLVERILPAIVGTLLTLTLFIIGLIVLIYAVQIGYSDMTGFGGRAKTASLYIPTSFGFDEWFRLPRSWMFASLVVGVALMIVVSVELILRQIVTLLGGEDRLPALPVTDLPEAE